LTYGLMRGNRKRTCPLVWLSKVEHPETRGQEGQSLIPVFYSTIKCYSNFLIGKILPLLVESRSSVVDFHDGTTLVVNVNIQISLIKSVQKWYKCRRSMGISLLSLG
ncbi:hypothetical protein D1B31_06710, partial [Neobacillus notoginsengisoli]